MSAEPEKRNNTTHQLHILAMPVFNQCMCALAVEAKTNNTQKLASKDGSSIRFMASAGQKQNQIYSACSLYICGRKEEQYLNVVRENKETKLEVKEVNIGRKD